jgi:HEAT repeat protein
MAGQPSSSDKRKLADDLIQSLHKQPWPGATNICNPACWMFRFTAPMQALLDLGSDAQESLIKALTDEEIRDQAIILLGGIGDERAVTPIIEAMKSATSDPALDRRRRTLLAGNLASARVNRFETLPDGIY